MSEMSEDLRAELRRMQKSARERSTGNNFVKTWSLSGKNAIVAPGSSVVARLAPRWDIGQSRIIEAGKAVVNPAYKPGKAFFFALEHWWEDSSKKWHQEYCPKSFGADVPCPICEASAAMLASNAQTDRQYGKKIQAREAYIFNAVVGFPRKADEKGLVDLRPLTLSNVLFDLLMDIVMGPENAPQFARGDVTDPRSGYDIVLVRPPANQQGARWSLQCAPAPTPLYTPEQAGLFAKWTERLTDLEAMVKESIKSYNDLYKEFMGREPTGAAAQRPQQPALGQRGPETSAAAPAVVDDPLMGPGPVATTAPVQEESAAEPESPDDAFMPPARAPRR